MIVIDASALIKYLLHEEGWEEVSWYLKEQRPLRTLDLALKEAANALWKHCCLRRFIEPFIVKEILQRLKRLVEVGVILIENESEYFDASLEISLHNSLTVYDSLYVAQALKYGELLTSDERQAKVAENLELKVYYVK
ncbi:MAG: type II toxin-antitoxin system VapC family toxin [Thermofilaceae archaeon]